MLYMVIASQPLKSTKEAAKVFAEAMGIPIPHVDIVGMWISYGGDGITNYSVVEMEKGHEEEASRALSQFFVKFYDIEGYKLNMIPVVKPENALAVLGMAPPA